MARFRNVSSGAVVDVREDKELGSEWEPITETTEKKPAARRSPAKKSDEK